VSNGKSDRRSGDKRAADVRAAAEKRVAESSAARARAKAGRKAIEVPLGFNWGRANTTLLVLGGVALVLGYIALSRGSTTLAPLLLVAGYCGLIPAALMVRSGNQESGE